MQIQSNYYSIIPMQVLLDKKLTDREKIIYAELTSLDSKKGYAWVSNGYLAKLFDMNSNSVSRCLTHLQERGYIKCEYGDNNSRQIVLTKGLTPINSTVKPSTPYGGDPINPTVNKESIDEKVNKESIDENIDLSKDKSISSQRDDEALHRKPTKSEIERVFDLFIELCPSFSKPRKKKDGTGDNYKFTSGRLQEYSFNEIKQTFLNAEASDFMKGKNEKGWTADYTWIMRVNNFPKVFENKYKNNKKLEEYKELKKQKDLAYIKNAEKQVEQKETSQQKDDRNLKKMIEVGEKMLKEWNDDNTGNNYIGEANQNALTNNSDTRT